jgi:hypothetical protein
MRYVIIGQTGDRLLVVDTRTRSGVGRFERAPATQAIRAGGAICKRVDVASFGPARRRGRSLVLPRQVNQASPLQRP